MVWDLSHAAMSDAKEACERIWSEQTLKVLAKLVGNAADHPEDLKYRGPVPKSSERIRMHVCDVPGASAILRAAGFQEDDSCFMIYEYNKESLCQVRQLLQDRESVVAGVRIMKPIMQKPTADSQQIDAASETDAAAKIPPVIRKKPKFDENILREIEAERQSNARWAAGASAGVLSCEKSEQEKVAPHPATAQQASQPSDSLRLRLRLPIGGQMELTVTSNQTVSEFMTFLQARTGVPVYHQQLRFGYPPVLLTALSDVRGSMLHEAGMRNGDSVYLDNLNDIFMWRLESGTFTMRELLDALPPSDGEHDTSALFMEALDVLQIGLEERNFWSVVREKMRWVLADYDRGAEELQLEALKAGLFVLQRLFHSYDPRQRIRLCFELLAEREMDDQVVHLECDRLRLVDSLVTQVLALSRQELVGKVEVHFKSEEGIDGGGLTRNMFSEFAQSLAESEPLLWSLTGRGSLEPTADVVSEKASHSSGLTSRELYRGCGRLFGMAVMNDCTLGRPLSRSFVRLLTGDPPQELADLQSELNHEAGEAEPDFRGGRAIVEKPLQESGLAGMLTLSRTISGHPSVGEVELVPGGKSIEVTDANKQEWLTQLLKHKLVLSQELAATAFRDGIIDVWGGSGHICPLLCLLSADELVDLWGGRGVEAKDVARWQAVTEVSPYVAQQAEWLWQVLKEDYNDELREKVLRFATGSARISREGVQDFRIEPAEGGDDRLPSAMTCGNMLQLPRYSSRFVLAKQLRIAAESCVSFAFA